VFPIALDLTKIPILLIGQGPLVARRQAQLAEYGVKNLTVKEAFSPQDMAAATIVMVAGLPREQAEAIVQKAHALGKLVNVEDINDLCDFYFTANVKRGDLIIAVSTSGASPTLARVIRDWLAERFGEEWAGHLRDMLRLRKTWKTEGADMTQVMENTKRHLKEQGWLLSAPSPACGGGLGRGQSYDVLQDPLPSPPPLRGRGDKEDAA
jgi:precorrin-2 dehydrogenase/sirohydrochlorin ferrochelatase